MIVLAVFAAALFICIGLDLSILIALGFGFVLFFGYGLLRGHRAREMFSMAFSGIKTVRNILITFVLIGVITAYWRNCGTIAYIVYHAMAVCDPRIMVLATFLLCALVSFLTGTAFGTAATMGVICASIATGMGVPLVYTGGSVLAGSYFGDRCSPMSTSALLIATLTKTDLYRNIVSMVKTSVIPFAAACAVYALMGLGVESACDVAELRSVFSENFVLSHITILPALIIVVLSCFRVNVKVTMSISILCAAMIAVFVQKTDVVELLRIALYGYQPQEKSVARLLSGGGIISMVRVFCIVCISSCYSGMFNGTGMLDGVQKALCRVGKRATPFGGVLMTSVLTGMISCNQTLTIMLTQQLCKPLVPEEEEMASHLENTAVVIAPLIPWSIAGAVPIAAVGAPTVSLLAACYLYFLPIWNLLAALVRKRHA